MKVLILLALAAYTQAIAPGDGQLDVVFALFGTAYSPYYIKYYMEEQQWDIDSGAIRVGLVYSGPTATLAWGLATYSTKAELLGALDELPNIPGGPSTIEDIRSLAEKELVTNTRPGAVMAMVLFGIASWVPPLGSAEGNNPIGLHNIHVIVVAEDLRTGTVYEYEGMASDPEYVIIYYNQVFPILEKLMFLDSVCDIGTRRWRCKAGLFNHLPMMGGWPHEIEIRRFNGGRYTRIREAQKTLMFEGRSIDLGDLDPCKTTIRCVSADNFQGSPYYLTFHLDWCGIGLGVHQNPTKSHRNWIVGQTLNHIAERGQGLQGYTLLYFNNGTISYPDLLPPPVRTPACSPQQEATVVEGSVYITSSCCGWAVRWTPRATCTTLEIFMDDDWANHADGICGNSDGTTCGDCKVGVHDGHAFVGGTRIHEDTIVDNPPPFMCY